MAALATFLCVFFTPIPCTYTSLLLDGIARNYYYFVSTWICKITQFIKFLPPCTGGEEKHLV